MSAAADKLDPKSPPPRSHRGAAPPKSQRSNGELISHREQGHEAFAFEPPPSRSEIQRMMCATAVRTLNEYMHSEEAVRSVCERWCSLGSHDKNGRQEAAESGAFQAIVKGLTTHASDAIVAEKTIGALGNLCCGTDDNGLARKQLAADAGVIDAIVKAMQTHVGASAVLENGAATVGNIASNIDEAGLARKQLATDAGALEAIVAGMKAHPAIASVQDFGCFALGNLVRGRGDGDGVDEASLARKQRAVKAGALEAVVAAMQAHVSDPRVQEFGARAISNVTFRSEELKKTGTRSVARDGGCAHGVTADMK